MTAFFEAGANIDAQRIYADYHGPRRNVVIRFGAALGVHLHPADARRLASQLDKAADAAEADAEAKQDRLAWASGDDDQAIVDARNAAEVVRAEVSEA